MTKPRAPRRQPPRRSNDARAPQRASELAAPAPAASGPTIRFLPSLLALVLAIYGVARGDVDDPAFMLSLLGPALALVAWNVWLLNAPAQRARGLTVVVELRKQHYLQACAQFSVYLYWGFSIQFPLVRDHLPLLAVQLVFAYAFDMLLGWSRRGRYSLGFGPFPVIFSTNLFLWFEPRYFIFQIVMVAIGFAAKEYLRWERDGRKVHIFNPSSFPLAVASIALILTATTDVTAGALIANTQAGPPHMHLMLFMVALPGQFLFGVASMTLSAVVTTYLFGVVYHAAAGTYFFFDLYLPIPVFLGMHLLFTDPSTSPRTELGRICFGVLYGLSTCVLYELFMRTGVPTFYDKLLQVPLLNLSVRFLDRITRTTWLAKLGPERLGPTLAPRTRYAIYTGLWAAIFATLLVTRGLGDRHPGQYWPYWIAACDRGNDRACAYLVGVEVQMCEAGSGWACNEAGIRGPQSYPGLDVEMDAERRAAIFRRGCDLGFTPACSNTAHVVHHNPTLVHAPPSLHDYPIILQGSRLGPLEDLTPESLHARACEQGWPGACEPRVDSAPQ